MEREEKRPRACLIALSLTECTDGTESAKAGDSPWGRGGKADVSLFVCLLFFETELLRLNGTCSRLLDLKTLKNTSMYILLSHSRANIAARRHTPPYLRVYLVSWGGRSTWDTTQGLSKLGQSSTIKS